MSPQSLSGRRQCRAIHILLTVLQLELDRTGTFSAKEVCSSPASLDAYFSSSFCQTTFGFGKRLSLLSKLRGGCRSATVLAVVGVRRSSRCCRCTWNWRSSSLTRLYKQLVRFHFNLCLIHSWQRVCASMRCYYSQSVPVGVCCSVCAICGLFLSGASVCVRCLQRHTQLLRMCGLSAFALIIYFVRYYRCLFLYILHVLNKQYLSVLNNM